jgi:hypothetical protein
MSSDLKFYLILTFISILLSVKVGKQRYIGVTWSIIYSIFCPILSIALIFLSKRKMVNQNPPSLFNWGLLGFLILFFSQYGKYPEGIYESLGALTIPVNVFKYKIPAEAIGYASSTNIFTIFPFYAFLRNFTLKYLP